MQKIGLWALRIVLGIGMFCASVGPKAANSNISDWLDRFGLKALARQLTDQQIDTTVLWICALLFFLTIFLPWYSKHFPARPRQIHHVPLHAETAPTPSLNAEKIPAPEPSALIRGMQAHQAGMTIEEYEAAAEPLAVAEPPTYAPPEKPGMSGNQRERLSSALAEIDDLMRESATRLTSEALYRHGGWQGLLGDGTAKLESAIMQFSRNGLAQAIEELEDKHGVEVALAGLTDDLRTLRSDAEHLTGPMGPVFKITSRLAGSGISDPAFLIESHMEAFKENADRWLPKARAIRETARAKRIEIEGRAE